MNNNSFKAEEFKVWFQKEKQKILQDLIKYINIDTSTPNEEKCFELINKYLNDCGFEMVIEKAPQNLNKHKSFSPHSESNMFIQKGNIRAKLKDNKKEETVLFNCHLDVVPSVDDFKEAFNACERDGKLIGRGACDTKNNLIMLLSAIKFLKDKNIEITKNVYLDLVVEEEIGGNGTLATVISGVPANQVICLEPTDLMVFRGHRGCISFDVEVTGKSVHMGSDQAGINAIEWTFEIVKLLKDLEKKLLDEAKLDKDFNIWDRPLQLNVGKIVGGEWSGSVPQKCKLSCDLGFLPKYSLDEIKHIVEETCRKVANKQVADNLKITFPGLLNDAYIIDENVKVVKEMMEACRNNNIEQSKSYGWRVSCDGRFYAKDANIPVIIFGSGSLSNAHSAHEFIDIDELEKGIKILADYLSTNYKEVER